MFQDLCGNLLILQCGQSTAVANACLAGAISEALNHEDHVEDVLGALGGLQGLINEDIIDLAAESQQTIRALSTTPGMALGTSIDHANRPQELEKALQVIQAHNIRYILAIGDSEALDLAAKLSEQAEAMSYSLATMAIPVTTDNSLPTTDHCPGYGSMAKNYASLLREVTCDVESLARQNQVVLVEVAGRTAGWATASTVLARRRNQPEDAPHLVYLPEVHFAPEKFVEDIRRVLEKQGWCMAVVSEGLVDTSGNYIAGQPAEGGSVSDLLNRHLREQLGVQVDCIRLGFAQRSASRSIALADSQEAAQAGQAAVRAALEGKTARMVTLTRAESDHYACDMGLVPIAEVGTAVKAFPSAWINEDGSSLSFQFSKYATPLIQGEVESVFEQGAVKLARLDKRRVAKKLALQPVVQA